MEWVETVGRSIQEAKEAALDELGVDASEAEFEIIADAQVGLFGRVRSEARVRARVKPRTPRTKEDRRDRRRRSASKQSQGDAPPTGEPNDTTEQSPGLQSGTSTDGTDATETDHRVEQPSSAPQASRSATPAATKAGVPEDFAEMISTKGPEVEVDLEQQGEVAKDFLVGLLEQFGLEANVSARRPDDDIVEIEIDGQDLGILIGPKGATLLALQTLTRTAVFNQTNGSNGHIYVDVAGYRAKRTEALARFAAQVAEQVKQSGKKVVLEAMPSPDRKVLHDAIAAIDGVHTVSDGEEPNRRVVVVPD
ncbi:MAG: RNA-binding cell elongation regulator Jag/EloR [Acidimicrobiales bacterium]